MAFSLERFTLPRPSQNYPRSKLLSDLPTSLQLFTVAEVAIILDVDVDLVNQWLNEKLLPSLKLGKGKTFIRIRAHDLENFIDTQVRVGKVNVSKK